MQYLERDHRESGVQLLEVQEPIIRDVLPLMYVVLVSGASLRKCFFMEFQSTISYIYTNTRGVGVPRPIARCEIGAEGMSISKVFSLIAGGSLLTSVALAATVELNPEHPDTYTVQKGDTLWNLSTRFLSEPWRWREIWQNNPQIENPDLVYPGDKISLIYTDGEPSLMLSRSGERPTIKLSPSVREIPLDQLAVPTIPIDAIQQFLLRPRIVGETELDEAPYIVSLGTEHLVGGAGAKIYARGFVSDLRNRYIVYRQGNPYIDPESGDVLGYEAIHIADAVLEKAGDPATMIISRSKREVLKGDRLLGVNEDTINSHLYPKPPDSAVDGQIISVVEGVTQIGQGHVVVLNLGTSHGIAVGDVMAVYQAGELIQDPLQKQPEKVRESYIEYDPERQGGLDGFSMAADRTVRDLQSLILAQVDLLRESGQKSYQSISLPEERAGLLMVFQPYDRISYALVVDAVRAMHVKDAVRNP